VSSAQKEGKAEAPCIEKEEGLTLAELGEKLLSDISSQVSDLEKRGYDMGPVKKRITKAKRRLKAGKRILRS